MEFNWFGCPRFPTSNLFVTHIISFLETFLDLSVSSKEERINIEGCNLLQADHPCNKKEEMFMYYKEYFPKIKRDNFYNLKESLVKEIMTGEKKLYLSSSCRSTSQTPDEFQVFCTDLNFTVKCV